MASISTLLNTIDTAIYGRDMRTAIHDAINLVNKDVETREPIVSKGTTSQYYRGDKTFQDFSTSVRGSALTGLSLTSTLNSTITASDTVLKALGKLQVQLNNKLSVAGGTVTGPFTVNIEKVEVFSVKSSEIYLNKTVHIDDGSLIQFGSDKTEPVSLSADNFIIPRTVKVRAGKTDFLDFTMRNSEGNEIIKFTNNGFYFYNGKDVGKSSFQIDNNDYARLIANKLNIYCVGDSTLKSIRVQLTEDLASLRYDGDNKVSVNKDGCTINGPIHMGINTGLTLNDGYKDNEMSLLENNTLQEILVFLYREIKQLQTNAILDSNA